MVCIGLILVVGAVAGMITTGDQVVAVIFAIIAGIVMHSLGVTVGKGRGLTGLVRSFADPDGTLKIVVAMFVLTGLEIYMILQGLDGATMYSVVVLIAGLAGYTQGKATGYEQGMTQRQLLVYRGTAMTEAKPG